MIMSTLRALGGGRVDERQSNAGICGAETARTDDRVSHSKPFGQTSQYLFSPNTSLCKSVFYADLLAPLLCLQRKYTLVIGDRRCQSILCNEGRFSSATRILCKLFWQYYDHINQFWVRYGLRNRLLLTTRNEVIA